MHQSSIGNVVAVDLQEGKRHGLSEIGPDQWRHVSLSDRSHGERHGPDFIVIGFSKCGSCTLSNILAGHPQIDFCRGKESNFFLWDFAQGWDWYESLFSKRSPSRLRGDGSIFYSGSDWERVASHWISICVPDVKFIWIARDPIKRIESAFREAHHSGHFFNMNAPYSIGEMLKQYPTFIRDTLYWERLQHYLERFPRNNMHILFLEDLTCSPARELERIWHFLGVDADVQAQVSGDYRINAGDRKLYDSRCMRFLRTSQRIGPFVRRLPPRVVDRVGRVVGLRIPFSKPVAWNAEDLHWTQGQLRDDARTFLEYAGKAPNFWPWVTAEKAATQMQGEG